MRKEERVQVLTVYQPWASLIAEGIQVIETRVWAPSWRPEYLLIHAAARPPQPEEVERTAEDAGEEDDVFPDAARVREFLATDPADWPLMRLVAVAQMQWPPIDRGYDERSGKRSLGWRIKRVRRIDSDRVRGQRRIWRIDRSLVRAPWGQDLPAHEDEEEIP